MRKIISIMLTGAFALGLSVVSMANTPVINRRLDEQRERINQGIRSGELTRREADRLESQEARIRTNLRYDRLDGHVGPCERAQLERELNRTSRNIYRDKHNRYVRP